MHYKGLVFKNAATPDLPFEIDIEGPIGYEPWDSQEDIISTKEQMKAELKTLGAMKCDSCICRINSLGGDVNHALSIHDLLKSNFKQITTEVNGTCASAATIIFAAGDIRRQSDNSLILCHRASTYAGGNVNDMNAAADDLTKFDNRIANIYAKITGKPIADMMKMMDENNGNGKWMLPDESKTMGLTTDVFEPAHKMRASISKEVLNRYKLPTPPAGFITEPEAGEFKSKQLKNIFKTVKKMIDNAKPATNPPENTMIKQFLNLNTALGVDKLESADNKGVYLNEAQLEKFSNALATAETARQTAVDSLATAESAHTAAIKTVTDEKAAAEASLATAITEVDEIDQTVKDAVDLPAKLTAIKAIVASKPGVPAPGIQGTEDTNSGAADGVKHEILDKLEHQQVAANMFGY